MTKNPDNTGGDNATATAASSPVRIFIGDNWVMRVDPLVWSLIDRLQFPRRTFELGGRLGHRSRLETDFAWGPDILDRFQCGVGLLNRVKDHLAEREIEYTLDDQRCLSRRLAPDSVAIAAMGDRDRQIAQAAVDSESLWGQIVVGERRVVHQIVQLRNAFPKARMVVVAAAMDTCYRLAKALGRELDMRVDVAGRGKLPPQAWLTVSTFTCLHQYRPDVIVVADAAEALGEGARWWMLGAIREPVRLLALRRPSLRLSHVEEIHLEGTVGPVIHRPTPPLAAVTVALCNSKQFPPTAEAANALERKRRAVWHHDGRNDLLAGLAAAFAAKDLPALQAHGLMLEEADERWLASTPRVRTVLLVESTEHARQLHRRLPGWLLKTGLPEDTGAVTSTTNTNTAYSNTDMPHAAAGEIVTLGYAAGHRTRADVVLRADGGRHPLPILRGFPPPAVNVSHGRCVLIDVLDDADLRERQDTLTRLLGYHRRGWIVDPKHLWKIEIIDFPSSHLHRAETSSERSKTRSNPSSADNAGAEDKNRGSNTASRDKTAKRRAQTARHADKTSSTAGLPDQGVRHERGSHSRLKKPTTRYKGGNASKACGPTDSPKGGNTTT